MFHTLTLEFNRVTGRGIRRWITLCHKRLWFDSLVVVNEHCIYVVRLLQPPFFIINLLIIKNIFAIMLSTFYIHKNMLPDQPNDLVWTIIQFHWSVYQTGDLVVSFIQFHWSVQLLWPFQYYRGAVVVVIILPLKLCVRTPIVVRCTRLQHYVI